MGSEKVNGELEGIAGADSPEVRAILSAFFFFSLPPKKFPLRFTVHVLWKSWFLISMCPLVLSEDSPVPEAKK